MRVLIISTSVYPIPLTGYGGLEQMVFTLASGLSARGHQVTIVAPEGSQLPEPIEHIAIGLREEEEKSWLRYKGRLEAGEWEVILDSSFQKWSIMSSAGREPPLPIVLWHHTHASVWGSAPPVRYPLIVGLSRSHAEQLSLTYKVPVRYCYNGIDTEFYKQNGKPRGERYLFMGRYTAEKNPLGAILLARRLKVGLDVYGDREIVAGQEYGRRCEQEADVMFARVYPGVSRETTVDLYSTHKALLHLHIWEEPFSLVVLEAMACGAVPIASNKGGPTELITNGETGFLVNDESEAEGLIKRDAVREISPQTMRQHVEQKFGLKQFTDNWEALLLRVVAGERW